MGTHHILARIAARTGVAMWRHRLAFVGAALAVGTLAAYELTEAGPTVSNGDCADTTMSAVTKVDDATAHAAYNCLADTMKQTSEDTFVATLRQRKLPPGEFSRVAAQRDTDGSQLVFYTVKSEGQNVGYIVYLNPRGLVEKVE
jgi:hypothetical protein